ncbi:MAG: hypothetical protein E7378_03025 [Clostridiales bacterium]|nr:hypothetical protein [Clostridiales bacterium]
MKHKTILSLNLICMILCCCVLSACKNNNTPNNNIPFVYTASTLMYDGCEILDFYSTDYSIIKNEDNSTIDASDCLYDSGNEDCSSLISKCYEFWTYCANGGYSYTDTNGNITNTYAIEFNGRQCTVKHTYQNNDLNPTSSAYRIIRNYDIRFSTDHISICYENEDESFYEEKKYYLDIYAFSEGVFIQYYKKTYNGDYFKTYSYEIYKFFYNETTDNLHYTCNKIKNGSTTQTLQDIETTNFVNFVLPDFLYTITRK